MAARRRERASETGSVGGAEPPGDESLPPFEESIEQLEAVVDRLESGELSLEDSLAAFEQGVRLTGQCAARLDAAEQRIERLAREGSRWVAERFEGAEPEAGADDDEADED